MFTWLLANCPIDLFLPIRTGKNKSLTSWLQGEERCYCWGLEPWGTYKLVVVMWWRSCKCKDLWKKIGFVKCQRIPIVLLGHCARFFHKLNHVAEKMTENFRLNNSDTFTIPGNICLVTMSSERSWSTQFNSVKIVEQQMVEIHKRRRGEGKQLSVRGPGKKKSSTRGHVEKKISKKHDLE